MLRMTQHAPLSTAEILRGLAVGQRPLGVGLQMLRADSLNAGVEFLRGIAVGKLWHGLGLELLRAAPLNAGVFVVYFSVAHGWGEQGSAPR